MSRRLKRSDKKMVCGVCAGVAEYLNVDVTAIRLVWVIISLFSGIGVLAYIAALFIMPDPDAEDDVYQKHVDPDKYE